MSEITSMALIKTLNFCCTGLETRRELRETNTLCCLKLWK